MDMVVDMLNLSMDMFSLSTCDIHGYYDISMDILVDVYIISMDRSTLLGTYPWIFLKNPWIFWWSLEIYPWIAKTLHGYGGFLTFKSIFQIFQTPF